MEVVSKSLFMDEAKFLSYRIIRASRQGRYVRNVP